VVQPGLAERSKALAMNRCIGDPSKTRSEDDVDPPSAEIWPGIEKCVPGLRNSILRKVSSSIWEDGRPCAPGTQYAAAESESNSALDMQSAGPGTLSVAIPSGAMQ